MTPFVLSHNFRFTDSSDNNDSATMIKVQIRMNICGHGDTFTLDSVLHVRYGLAVFELLSCTE